VSNQRKSGTAAAHPWFHVRRDEITHVVLTGTELVEELAVFVRFATSFGIVCRRRLPLLPSA